MASKIKVDQLETADGTGTIALQNQLSGLTSASMPTGSVLQVVTDTSTTKVDITSSTWTDLGLTASITPISSSSKILILAHCPATVKGSNTCYSNIKLYKSAPSTATLMQNNRFEERHGYDHTTYWSINYVDSPATTSQCTYKIQGKNDTGSGTASYVLDISNAGLSSITLMEIAG